MTLNLEHLDQIPKIVSMLDEALKAQGVRREWIDLKAAAELKGVNYNTLRSTLEYQPNGGQPDAIMHGRRVWRHSTIIEWLEIHDGNRLVYLTARAKC